MLGPGGTGGTPSSGGPFGHGSSRCFRLWYRLALCVGERGVRRDDEDRPSDDRGLVRSRSPTGSSSCFTIPSSSSTLYICVYMYMCACMNILLFSTFELKK